MIERNKNILCIILFLIFIISAMSIKQGTPKIFWIINTVLAGIGTFEVLISEDVKSK